MSYDAFASTFSQSRKNLRWGEIEYFVEYMKNIFPTPMTMGDWGGFSPISILDVGCGNGRFIDSLESSEPPCSYLGIDASTGMIEEAKKLHPNNTFQVLDMKHLEELSGEEKYDIIVFIASFHHLHTVQERAEVLEKTKKLLKRWGVVLMTNWNLRGEPLFSKYRNGYWWNGDFQIKIGAHERYYHGFTIAELDQLFQENGYEVIENRVFEGGKNIISIFTK